MGLIGSARRLAGAALRSAARLVAGAHPSDPALVGLFGAGVSAAGISVTPETALDCPPVYACVQLVTRTVATIPLNLYRRTGPDAQERATGHPLHALLHDRPNPWQTSAEFRAALHVHLMTYGNGYARVIWRNDGLPEALEPLHPREIWPFRSPGGIAYRWLPQGGGESRILLGHEVLHLRRPPFTFDLTQGESPVERHRETIGAAMATLLYLARFFSNNAIPKGAVEIPGMLSDPAVEALRESWERQHRGVENAHRLAVLWGGMKFHQIGVNAADAQLIETYRELVAQIAAVFGGIPLHMIGETDRSTSWGTGIEQQSIGFVTHCLRPELVLWEQALNRTLLTDAGRAAYFFEYNVDGLLRGDHKTRMEGYALMIQWGLATPNEVRRLMNLAPLPGGDSRLQPLNMAPAEKIIDILLKPDAKAIRTIRDLRAALGGLEDAGPFEHRIKRVPAGSPQGGQFAPEDGGAGKGKDTSRQGFKIGRLAVELISEALGINLEPGHARLKGGKRRKIATKHRREAEQVLSNLSRAITRPHYVGVHPDHPDHIGLVVKVKGLPGKNEVAIYVPVSKHKSGDGWYDAKSGFAITQSSLDAYLAAGTLKPVGKKKGPPKRSIA